MHTKTRIVIGFIFLTILMLLRILGVFDHITMQAVREYSHIFATFVHTHYVLGVLGYISMYVLLIIFALPIATLMTLLGGFLFGTLWGGVYAVIAATLGAMISFLIVRYLIGDVVQKMYTVQLQKFNKFVDTYGKNALLLLRFVPIFPFFLINICAGLTVIPLYIFFWTTFFGIMPSAFIFSFAGKQLHTITSVQDILSWPVLITFLLLGMLALIPFLMRKNNMDV